MPEGRLLVCTGELCSIELLSSTIRTGAQGCLRASELREIGIGFAPHPQERPVRRLRLIRQTQLRVQFAEPIAAVELEAVEP